MIIFEDADVDRAVNDAIKGAFSNSGQVCSSSSRLIIHENIFDQFIYKFKTQVSKLKVGNPLDNPDLGPVVSESQYNKIYPNEKIMGGGAYGKYLPYKINQKKIKFYYENNYRLILTVKSLISKFRNY